MARRPDARSWTKLTCSCPVVLAKTPTPDSFSFRPGRVCRALPGARGGGDRSPTSGRRGWCAPGVPRGRVVPDSAAAVGPAQPTVLSADANYVGFVATVTPAGD